MGARGRHRGLAAAFFAVAVLTFLAPPGCSSSHGGGSLPVDATFDGTDAGEEVSRAPTYAGVYEQVLLPNCASPFCHAGSGDYLELSTMAAGYASLVDAEAQGPDCAKAGFKRVNPGHPETSLLYLKITNPPCGAKMPKFYGDGGSLGPVEIEQIKAWIALGALND